MAENNEMMEDIIDSHPERMNNLSKYYPFFKLMDNAFGSYKDIDVKDLDMPYLVLAVLRYLIEENHFNHKKVTYDDICGFIGCRIREDFGLTPEPDRMKALESYIFDKMCNDGRPFILTWFDPCAKKKRISRIRFIESRYDQGQLHYILTEEALSFYLDTKEIREESRISVEHILLSKMVSSKNFKGGLDVVARIGQEVSRLEASKDQVLRLLGHHVFEGVQALDDFMNRGMAWFEQEHEMFAKNKALVDQAMAMCTENETLKEINALDRALKTVMRKHENLLDACTKLQIQADQMISRAKHNRFRKAMDFENYKARMMEADSLEALAAFVKPLFGLKMRKTLPLSQLDDLLTCKIEEAAEKERIVTGRTREYIYEDEAADLRIETNFKYFLKILFERLLARGRVSLTELNRLYTLRLGSDICDNGDYYTFLAHISQKNFYDLSKAAVSPDTFLEAATAKFLISSEWARYRLLKFKLTYMPETLIETKEGFYISEIIFERTEE